MLSHRNMGRKGNFIAAIYVDFSSYTNGRVYWKWKDPVLNKLRPRQNGRHLANDAFKRIFLNGNVKISIEMSLKFAPKGPINKIPELVQIMAWRR